MRDNNVPGNEPQIITLPTWRLIQNLKYKILTFNGGAYINPVYLRLRTCISHRKSDILSCVEVECLHCARGFCRFHSKKLYQKHIFRLMKLHLPKSLFIAVLAAIASELPTYALTGYGNGFNLSGDTYYIDGTATTDTVITHKEDSAATQINIASDVTDLIKEIGGANLTKDVTMVVCQNPWPNSPHNFDTLTLNSIETQNGAKVVLKVQDGISTVVGAVNGNGSIRGGEIEAESQLTLGTSAGSTTLSGTFVNAGSLIINGAITVSDDADMAKRYVYTGLYSKDKNSANASASSNGFGQYSEAYDLIVESRGEGVATIEQKQITYKGEIKNLETLGDSSVGVMTSTGTGFSDVYFVNESETLASSTSSSYVLADEATMTWSDERTGVNNISVKGNGTVIVTIGATDGHGNIINLGREFNGILEINKSADAGSGKVELHRYELGENATLRLVSGDYWGWGHTINTNIILAGKKADDFTFSHWGTVTVAGKITGSYLTSAGSLTLTHGENNIENVKLTGDTTLNVNNSMTFGTVVAPHLSIADNKELTIGYEAGASSSTISSLILNGLGKLNIREGAEVYVNGVTSGGDGLAKILVKKGEGTLTLSGTNSYTGGTKVEAGTLIVSEGSSLGTGDIDVTGGELQVSGADAITATNLNISNGTVVASYSGSGSSVISNDTTVNVGTGGTLKLTGHDMLGWSAGAAPAKIVLGSDDASKKAKLDIQDTGSCTFAPEVEMNGNAEITGTSISTYGGNTQIPNASTSDASDVVEGSRITVSKGENSIKVENLEIRRALELAIAKDATLTINSLLKVAGNAGGVTGDRCITKSGEGTLVITNAENTWNKKLHVTGGTLSLQGAASMPGSVTMASGTRLETGTGTIGSLDMAGGTTLDADTTVSVSGALTLGTGIKIKLEGDIVNALYSGTEKVTLFSGIDSLSMGGTTYDPSASVAYTPVDITSIFDIENMEEGRYNLYYEGGELFAELTAAVPEPATATLSLLALAGLCARRRRKA